ncbi:MAG: NAD(P)-dependent oxidoreductase, partial [Clostridia bacterium]
DRGFGDMRNLDFISIEKPIRENVDILTNPPYTFAKEFVLKAIELLSPKRKCFMFLKLQFLEGKARFKELFSKFPPKTIYVFSSRIMCAKNANFKEMEAGGGSAVAYAWFVWEKGYNGRTTINWL